MIGLYNSIVALVSRIFAVKGKANLKLRFVGMMNEKVN